MEFCQQCQIHDLASPFAYVNFWWNLSLEFDRIVCLLIKWADKQSHELRLITRDFYLWLPYNVFGIGMNAVQTYYATAHTFVCED